MISNIELTGDRKTLQIIGSSGKKEFVAQHTVKTVCLTRDKRYVAAVTEREVLVIDEAGRMKNILKIPARFPNAICIHDAYYEADQFTVILAQYKGYDIAYNVDPLTGKESGWHYVK